MKTVFRILLGLVVAVIVLMVAAAVLLPVIYDKEDLKQEIAVQVQKQTGRELSIDGPLDFSVFPWIAVEVNELSLSNAKGFGEQPFAKIGQARVGVALMPLLHKQISVDEITLNGLQLALAVNERGQNNWDDLAEVEEAEAASVAADEPGLFSSKRVAGLNIRDSSVEFQDRQAGTHYRISDFSLQAGELGDGRPVPLDMTMMLEDLAANTRMEVGLETTLTIDTKAHTLQMDPFTLELAGLRARGSLSAHDFPEEPDFTGTLETDEFSPVALMRDMQIEPPVTTDPQALQHARLSTSFAGDPAQIALSDLNLELDQSRLSGNLSIMNLDQPRAIPKIGFEFNVDEIDLDRYLAPSSEEAEADVAMPRKELQGQDLQGTLHIARMRLAGLDFSDAELGLTIRGGKLRLNPLTAGFYGGTSIGDIQLDSSGSTPLLSIDEKIDSITFQRLVADLVDTESLSGTALGHVKLTGRGATSNEVVRSLSGDLALTLTEGALEGINIWYEIRRGLALYKGMAPPPPEPKRTVFSRMQLSAGVADGVITTRELVGDLPFLTLNGSGKIDLAESHVDLGLVATVRKNPELAQDPLAADISGKRLPFKVSGALDNPGVSVDWEALLKGKATDMLMDKLGLSPDKAQSEGAEASQEAQQPEEQLEDKAKGALFDLLRKKDKDKDGG